MPCNLVASKDVLLRDQQHAARLFTDDNMRLAPKFKHLFHVSFGINPAAVTNKELVNRYRNEINLLVKSIKLPDIDIITEVLNQYNRKKVVQVQQKFTAITIKFHEDNAGIINLLWQNYYRYYYADPSVATVPGAYIRNATMNSNYTRVPYGLDNGSSVNFFNYVKVYQMARHEYVCYTLHNPMISRWSHDQLEYGADELSEHNMTIDYEAVSYSSGRVSPGNPEGFALTHYDLTPSPLRTGPSNEISVSRLPSKPATTEQRVKQVNQAQNTKPFANPGTKGVINQAVLASSANTTGVSGLNDVIFPTVQSLESITANLRRVV